MTKEEFLQEVLLRDKRQGNFALTKEIEKKLPNLRKEKILEYTDVAIAFYEWAISQGEKVYVFEDIFKNSNKVHPMAHFVFPEHQLVVRMYKEQKKDMVGKFANTLRPCCFFFYIDENDDLRAVIKKFWRVVSIHKSSPRKGFVGEIIKNKRKRFVVAANKVYEKVERKTNTTYGVKQG